MTKFAQNQSAIIYKLTEQINRLEAKIEEKGKELASAKAKGEAILQSIGDALVVTDQKGTIILVNKAFEEMMGWAEAEAKGKSFMDLVKSEDEEGNKILGAKRKIMIILSGGANYQRSGREAHYYVRRDGTRFPVNAVVTPIIFAGRRLGAVQVFRDITVERDIDRAKTEFVSLASHQLKTPLSVINWYTEMLIDGDAGGLNEKQRRYINEVARGSHRMVDLVNSLLNVSRLELGTFIVEPEKVDLKKIVRSVLDEFKVKIDEKKLKITFVISKSFPKYLLDPKLTRIIVQNLVSNSIKYTSNGGWVKIAVGQVKDKILISVLDDGCGIPAGQQSNIFNKLFRADNARVLDPDGTGLGLYIVKTILANVGGEIWFKSREKKGTNFFVTLPCYGMRSKKGRRELEVVLPH
ncbi:hypothetical protein A3D84_04745 [Candidatus Woesebacteria bacterium RIFCSPHIGHO2_02_FULL_42_20]|uniref:histidine kinase n=1 Tax=Candidatus Woesebacteria bacterium RIFCSPHIGHO2_12_FULL_41_24 TaxID=1802510 RepID=A0A1F8ATC3_9BACT|nr:MAG: hypothetical protein A2W15_01130 [Candidatus Woesebacteria bacterium RBG_16_41_13]OGM29043.1 MAG: hypothetical protein A2873_03775 [Candidatus Woesebacteria bacterium RIFCSPHIGHO2_01_FULL_42_80]OGM35033.1 MAG: hypothetical protein A3D84_04745 [Candidatus Woesebacteria bacterium RIFCSPHIGHO2_02_FULL_42_20]OGM54739.1 MAG: hypothetical protein A3E44_02540 [Candidatus Woesebacteria bacterium RIFCSPHIGHO2_12_FULL_41_24]OGM66586.1 MAG: hypothetical protein A2969_01335 [Candidatus Woesebacteri